MANADAEDLERQISRLPRDRTSRSFEILADWLRENRRALHEQIAENRVALERQITGLAIRFEEIDRANKEQLSAIHNETRETNGRVTGLENAKQLEHAVADGREHWESEQEQKERENREVSQRRREKIQDRAMSVALVLLGLIGGGTLQHFGL